MKKAIKILYSVLIVILLTIFIGCGVRIAGYIIESKKQGSLYHALAEQVEAVRNSPDDAAEPVTLPGGADPQTGDTPTILPEYAELYAYNSDMVGWIRIPDTGINYPVMQTPGAPDYYLYRNFDKGQSSHGALYINEDCDVYEPSDNITIYGHNMKDGSMFAGLNKFKDEDFFQDHRSFTFDTLTGAHTYQIFAVFTTTASVGEGFSYHSFVNACDEKEFNDFVAACKALSHYDTGVTPEYGDKLICLSTCDYTRTNGRLVVAAMRIS